MLEDAGHPWWKLRCTQRGLDYDKARHRLDNVLASGVNNHTVEPFLLESERSQTARRANVPASGQLSTHQAVGNVLQHNATVSLVGTSTPRRYTRASATITTALHQ